MKLAGQKSLLDALAQAKGRSVWLDATVSGDTASVVDVLADRSDMADVSVRSNRSLRPGTSRKMVSRVVRAGWSGGMFSAWKLYQSVSTSGPSTTRYPSLVKMSTMRYSATVNG